MRGLFWVVALFATAVGLSLLARFNDGYVLIFVAPKRIEMSLTLFALLEILLFFLCYVLVRAASYTLRLPDMVREFRDSRARERARHALFDALTGLYEGRFLRAERAARQAFENGDEPVLSALVAARAAHRLEQGELADEWLGRARQCALESGGKAGFHAVLMTQAEILSARRRDAEALVVLRELRSSGARHVAAQLLMLRSLSRSGQWEEALRTARQLAEHKTIHPAELRKVTEAAFAGLFGTDDAAAIRERLRRLARSERRDPVVVRVVARALLGVGMTTEACELIEPLLDSDWDETLGEMYGDCADAAAETSPAWLQRVEGWVERYPGAVGPLVVLGRLCARRQLWGKAQASFELALARGAGRQARLALAKMYDATGRRAEADQHYRAAALS